MEIVFEWKNIEIVGEIMSIQSNFTVIPWIKIYRAVSRVSQ